MTIIEMWHVIKEISEKSGLVSEVKLIKSVQNIDEIIDSSKMRSVLVSAVGTDGSEADDFVYKILIVDKVSTDNDEEYLSSINDSLSLAKDFQLSSTKVYNNRAIIRNLNINSGIVDEEMIVTVDFDLAFEFDAVPF